MNEPTIQVQSVIYQNDPASLRRTIEHLANAIRVERESVAQLGGVKLIYGDAVAIRVDTDQPGQTAVSIVLPREIR